MECGDVLKLQYQLRNCLCGQSNGKYLENGVHAEYSGPSRILGIDNQQMAKSYEDVTRVPYRGPYYEWFVLEEGWRIRKTD